MYCYGTDYISRWWHQKCITCHIAQILSNCCCGIYSVNPITGRWEEVKPSPMEGMTEEQKEYEAMQLVNKLDKLQRSVNIPAFHSN